LRTVRGEPSWVLASDCVEAALTRDGGHLAPVVFHTPNGPVQPFAIAPWADAPRDAKPAGVLRMLRGDFFCFPFGGANRRGEEDHPPHGETAVQRWDDPRLEREADGTVRFSSRLRVRARPGVVRKEITLRSGETNVYCRHVLEGFSGPMCLGHHAMLDCAGEAGAAHLALSPWQVGRVHPAPFEDPAAGGYSALRAGATFRSLSRVPLAEGGWTDLSRYPAREGYDDVVLLGARPPEDQRELDLGWAAVTFPARGYLWFSLKNRRLLPSTALWCSNGGRHYPPWSGRHRGVLGVEDVIGALPLGLAASARRNAFSRAGVPTVLQLSPEFPVVIPYVMGVVPVPPEFGGVAHVQIEPRKLIFTDAAGHVVVHPVDTRFLNVHVTNDSDTRHRL
jgi:hypothetical protein